MVPSRNCKRSFAEPRLYHLPFFSTSVSARSGYRREIGHPAVVFIVVMGTTTLLATCLHGGEAAVWALAYRLLHEVPDDRSALLYSLSAITSYGHADLVPEPHWQLMGAIEALNGWLP